MAKQTRKPIPPRAHAQYGAVAAQNAGPEKQLMDYLPLVKFIAGRIAMGVPRSVELDDLISAGVVGLIEAFNSFDSEKGVKFESYASIRVRGAILDELRAVDWAPRSTRAKSREMERAITVLENRGYVLEDPAVEQAVRTQRPFVLGAPRSPAARCIAEMARAFSGDASGRPAASGLFHRLLGRRLAQGE